MILLTLLACGPAAPPLRYPDLTAAILARVDLDHDGRVDAEEYARVGLEDDPLSRYDADGDGALSPYELESSILTANPATLAGARIEGIQGPLRPGGGPPGGGPPGGGPPGGGRPPGAP